MVFLCEATGRSICRLRDDSGKAAGKAPAQRPKPESIGLLRGLAPSPPRPSASALRVAVLSRAGSS